MVSEPQKELRFTRSGQAVHFCIFGALWVAGGVTLLATSIYREANPELPHPLWAIPCFMIAAGAFVLARHLAKHAYLILTPLGLEIFPFFRPAKNVQMLLWQEITDAEIDAAGRWITLHFNEQKTAGMHLSLRPIRSPLRELLGRALLGRVKQ
ncbi:hypothetical protein ACFSSA_11490 [Luteolibacter algae]|uniref:PH domain-containing protein n=1 Tax=Luteolibacter algae TaxID=454151 RepID=A0ABW5D8Z2_9BACT